MTKNALFCVNIIKENTQPPAEFSFAMETFKRYCRKYDLDLIVIDKRLITSEFEFNYEYIMLEKFQLYEYLKKYDRVLKIDLDTLITASCPNIFDVVPTDCVGVVFEDIGKRTNDRRKQMTEIQNKFGRIDDWTEGYFNAGMIVMSKCHNEANNLSQEDLRAFINQEVGLLHEQNIINWKVRSNRYKIYPLDYRYNHMFMFDEVNFANIKSGSLWKNRAKTSFILHYAGLRGKLRYRRMKRDFKNVIKEWG
ncbi:MAG: glycosyltransferase [bacterium]